MSSRFPENGTAIVERDGFSVTLAPSVDLQGARLAIAELNAPASRADISKWLARLTIICIVREEVKAAGEAAIALYVELLEKYPGDVVRAVLANWTGKFFPAWGELHDSLEALMGDRRALAVVVENISAVHAPLPSPANPAANPQATRQIINTLEHRASCLRMGQPAPEDRNCPREEMSQRAEDLEQEAYALKDRLKGAA